MRPADRLGAGFRQADMSDLAGFDEFLHRAHRLFDRRIGIDTVEIVEVDMVDAEPPQRPFAGCLCIVWPSVGRLGADAGHRSSCSYDAELGCQYHLVTPVLDRLPNEFFVGVRTIGISRIE